MSRNTLSDLAAAIGRDIRALQMPSENGASPDETRIADLEQYCGAEAADRLAAAYQRLQNAGKSQP